MARELILTQPFAIVAVVEGEAGDEVSGFGGFVLLMAFADRDQSGHLRDDDLLEPLAPLGVVPRREALLARRVGWGLAQQSDRLEGLRRLPGEAAVEDVAELHPTVEQPEAAGGRGFELWDEGRGIIGAIEQPAAQLGGLVVPATFLGVGRVLDRGGQGLGLHAVGPIEPPGGLDRLLDQGLLLVITGLQVGNPEIEPLLIGAGVLVGQDDRLGAPAVFQRVEPRTALALGGLRPSALPSVTAAGLGAIRAGCGRGHGGIGPRCIVKIGGIRNIATGGSTGRTSPSRRDYRTETDTSPLADLIS